MSAPQTIDHTSIDWNAYHLSRPKPPELFLWPVHRDYLCVAKPVRVFDTWDEASTFAMANNLYMGEPKRRAK